MHDVDYVKPWLKCNLARKRMIESGKVTDSSRSNKPTDFLNNEIIRIFKNTLPEQEGYTFKTEKKIPCSRGGTFKVDVLVYKNNNLHAGPGRKEDGGDQNPRHFKGRNKMEQVSQRWIFC